MRIAVFSALFPPNIIGGAEISASNLAVALSSRGHRVSVLTTTDEQPFLQHRAGESISAIYDVSMPRPYQIKDYASQSQFRKIIWHLQDHASPQNVAIWSRFLDEVNPEVAMVHVAQGIGFNGVLALAKRGIPTILVLHDLSWICIRTSMFRKGRNCEKPCFPCNVSRTIKGRVLSRLNNLTLISPSAANLNTFLKWSDVKSSKTFVVPNANNYPIFPRVKRQGADSFELLYVGQISDPKGVPFIMKVLRQLSATHRFRLRVLGDGPALAPLRQSYLDCDWVTFEGHVSQSQVGVAMSQADALLVPSLWQENYPGVVVQALQAGLPCVASDTGGIPELVTNGVSGLLIAPGDASAWLKGLESIFSDRRVLDVFSLGALESAQRFSVEAIVSEYESILNAAVEAEKAIERTL